MSTLSSTTTTNSIQPLAHSLERLLIFKEVFAQHIQTCENIITGNCLARDTLADLKNYFARNLDHFNPFVQSLCAVPVPVRYQRDLEKIVMAVTRYRNAIEDIIEAIDAAAVDQVTFRMGVKQSRALDWVDGAYIDQLRLADGQFGYCSMVG
ncbi:hypothetical protein [Lacticaseibacillus thailandensis]|uniref:Uncharacterized protein n=1 Tax=Lacticaseibacillus thailandensis DSM 22698 = JCM 13996 TaxID=1423810 RepID=A0A0R2C908_9LACO|nr:hypothetical protein [Lacticaseibacillus thailandensis]KRM88168.1 hypothetical protein FD19_GL000458 [Lacticaseibacillus thailandensis DSM 22698 = JCM 13996]